MIEQGQLTMIGSNTYRCIKVKEGYAYLKNILHEQGRATKVKVEECPYIENDVLIVPEKKVEKKPRTRSKLNLSNLMKEHTDLQISRSAKNFLMEWVETAIANQIASAERNAIRLGHGRLTAAHFYWLETNHDVEGYWKEHEEYING